MACKSFVEREAGALRQGAPCPYDSRRPPIDPACSETDISIHALTGTRHTSHTSGVRDSPGEGVVGCAEHTQHSVSMCGLACIDTVQALVHASSPTTPEVQLMMLKDMAVFVKRLKSRLSSCLYPNAASLASPVGANSVFMQSCLLCNDENIERHATTARRQPRHCRSRHPLYLSPWACQPLVPWRRRKS